VVEAPPRVKPDVAKLILWRVGWKRNLCIESKVVYEHNPTVPIRLSQLAFFIKPLAFDGNIDQMKVDALTQFEPFVDASAVAAYLKVTHRQVLEMTRRGVIPGHPLGIGTSRRLWRYKLSEVEAAVTSDSKRPLSATTRGTDCLAADGHLSTMKSGSPRSQRRKLNG
jgi:hypothetical protein